MSKDLNPLPHFSTEPGACLLLYKTARNEVTRSVLHTDHPHHGSLDPHSSGGGRCSLPASSEDWQATEESPSRPTNTAIDWEPSSGMNGEIEILPGHG